MTRRMITGDVARWMTEERRRLEMTVHGGRIRESHVKGGPVLLCHGMELEFQQVEEADGSPTKRGPELLRAVGSPLVVSEYPTFVGECTTDPHADFTVVADQLHRLFGQVMRSAEGLKLRPVLAGVAASFDPAELVRPQDWVSTYSPRYAALLAYLSRTNRGKNFMIRGIDKPRWVSLDSAPAAGGLTSSVQQCVQVPARMFGLAANLVLATAWVAPLVGSTSSVALGETGEWAYRNSLWKGGMGPGYSPFGIGRYFRDSGINALLEWFAYVQGREQILDVDDAISARFPVYRTVDGTAWQNGLRPRFCDPDDESIIPYLEVRLWDAGPTFTDTIANSVLQLCLLAGLLAAEQSAEQLSSYEQAEGNWERVALDGNVQISWRGRKCSALQAFLEDLLPIARQGVVPSGIDPVFANRNLDIVEHRMRSGGGGAIQMVERFRAERAHSDRLQASRAVMLMLADMLRAEMAD